MARGRRRKCKCCQKIFCLDPGNRRHQRYCSAPRCRRASKAASQARWLGRAENVDYFRGPVHLARCQDWRARHPGYWRKASLREIPSKEVASQQAVDLVGKTGVFASTPLQDLVTVQPAVLIGLIAHLVGTPVQEEIAQATDRLLRLGQDILAMARGPPTPPP